MGRISGFQQFPEFLETFWGNFYTICRCLPQHVPLLLEIFLGNNPKSRLPFT